MYINKSTTRGPLGGRRLTFITTLVLFLTVAFYPSTSKFDTVEAQGIFVENTFAACSNEVKASVECIEPDDHVIFKSNEEIAEEVIMGLWGNGKERITKLNEAGYDYDVIQSIVDKKCGYTVSKTNNTHVVQHSNYEIAYSSNFDRLTLNGGFYINPNTGLKETWYSQRVLPGGGLIIPGRHVNSDGLVCDGNNYICVASSTYPKGTIIETSLGLGKVYDCGCDPGTIDIYVNW